MSVCRCDKCDQLLDVVSDAPFGYGKLSFVHPNPCVPKIRAELKPEDYYHDEITKYCQNRECGKAFHPKRGSHKQLCCSIPCTNAVNRDRRLARYDKEMAQKKRKRYTKRNGYTKRKAA